MKFVIILPMLLRISARALEQGAITQALFPNENAHPEDIPSPPVNYLQPPVAKSLYKSEPYPPPPATAYGLPPPDYYRTSYEKSSTVPETPSYQPNHYHTSPEHPSTHFSPPEPTWNEKIPTQPSVEYSKSPEEPLRHLPLPVTTWNDKIPIQPVVEFAPHVVSPIAPSPKAAPILPLLPLAPMPMMGD